MITELRKFVAPEFMFGVGARKLAARYAKNFGASKALIVTDPGIIEAGWAKELTDSFESAGIPYIVFPDVSPNPRVEEVMAGADLYERERCDVIVVIGGGSPMDCAKGIGIASSNRKNILAFEGVDRIPAPGPPLISIPTTAGSSADVSQFAIITDTARRLKIAIISKMVVPDVSLIDPATLTTMPADLTANSAMDALAHAFESYVSNAHSPMTDLFALEAARLVSSHVIPAIENPGDLDIRSSAMLGSLYAGLAFSNASLGLIHAMAHSLGGYLDIPHGKCNSLLIDRVAEFNFESAPDRYGNMGEAIGVPLKELSLAEKKASLLDALAKLKKAVHADVTLGELGVDRQDIPELARKALNDPCAVTNPRTAGQKDVEYIYEQAF